jgi:hypothetical protein
MTVPPEGSPKKKRAQTESASKVADYADVASDKDLSTHQQSTIDRPYQGTGSEVDSVWSIDQRDEMLKDHPVVRGHYIVPTPMLIHAHQEARDRVWSRRTGVVFYGETRAGKTTCAMSIRDFLREEFSTIYISMASGRQSLRPKEGHMARLILEGSGHALAKRSDPDALLRNVILDIQINVANLGGDQYALILDEVNLCNEFDLTTLLQIHNILWMKGIKMTTISFGQPDILNLINSLLATEQKQIIARFFRKPIPFLNCNAEETLASVLRSIDEDTEWPEGSGWTYTYFFFPRAFKNGFRLCKYATAIWNGLANASPGSSPSFPMETIALTINGLYLGLRNSDHGGLDLSEKDISRALASADL